MTVATLIGTADAWTEKRFTLTKKIHFKIIIKLQ